MAKSYKAVATNSDFLPLRRSFIRLTGSYYAATFLNQVIYWYQKSGNKPFYKFRAPNNHELYKEGDSWCEELELTPTEFDTMFKSIGAKISKGQPKPDNVAVWAYRTQDNRTFYQPNVHLLDWLFEQNANGAGISFPIPEDMLNAYRLNQELSPSLGNLNSDFRNHKPVINTEEYTKDYTEDYSIKKGSDGLGFTDNGNNEVKGNGFVTFRSEEKQSNPPSSAAPPLKYGSRIPKYGQLSIDYFEVQELLKVHPDAVLDLTPSTKHTFEELGRTYGIEKVKEVAKWLGDNRASQYLPKVVNFIQAEQFAGDLNSMITAKQFAPPKALSQKTTQHPLTKGPQPKLII